MATGDNTLMNPGTGGDLAASDELVTLNGVTLSGQLPKAQRIKIIFGDDGDGTDASKTNPLPIIEWDSELSSSPGLTPLRDRLTAQRYTVQADPVTDSLATFWTQNNFSGGAITVTGGEGVITSSANASGQAILYSTVTNYWPGQVQWFSSAIRLGDTGSAGNIRQWGVAATTSGIPNDGFFFELNGTALNAVTIKAGTATRVASGSWSRATQAPFTLDTNYHQFEIRWTANNVYFFVDNVLRHVVSGAATPLTSTLNFSMFINNTNTTAASRTIAVRNIGVGRFGAPDMLPAGTNTIGSVKVTDTSGTVVQGARADGFFRVAADPTTWLFDTFETLDTTNTWTTGGSAAPTVSAGVLTATTSTTANASTYIVSKPTFIPGSSAFLQSADLVTLAGAVQFGGKAIWGLGVIAGSPTAAVPLSNGAVFEVLDTDGNLYGAIYSGGSRSQSVLLTRPTDGATHRYSMYYKASRVYFEIDNVVVGSLPFPNPTVAALSKVFGVFNGTSLLSAPIVLNASLLGVADTGRNFTGLRDGTFPWRTTQVGKNGGLSVKGAPVPALSTNFAATATGTAGPYDVSEAGNITFILKNQIAATAFTGSPVIVFEQSDDNVSWSPLAVTRGDTLQTGTTFTITPPGASASILFNSAAPGMSYVRVRVTTGTTLNGMTIAIVAGGFLYAPQVAAVERKDTGRTPWVWFVEAATGVTSEALVSMTPAVAFGTAGSGATTYAVPAGKTLRITSMLVSFVVTTAAFFNVKLRLRSVASGTASVSSPVILSIPRIGLTATTTPTVGQVVTVNVDIPDGFEVPAGASIGLTQVFTAADGTLDVQMTGFLY